MKKTYLLNIKIKIYYMSHRVNHDSSVWKHVFNKGYMNRSVAQLYSAFMDANSQVKKNIIKNKTEEMM